MGSTWWSEEEKVFLQENYGVKTNKYIAKKLKRTEVAVAVKASKLHLSKDNSDFISLYQLSIALGFEKSYSSIKKKFLDNGLKVTKDNKLKIETFWKWAEDHKQILNFSKFEKNLLGIEPKWVDEKRKADLSNPRKISNNRPWTKEDDSLLIQKTKSCRYTYKDLARDLKRTENAIKRRLYTLKVPYRPIPLDTHIKWTDEENNKLLELYRKGFDTYVIANMLNKSQLSISDRIKKLGG